MNKQIIDFVAENVKEDMVKGKDILEVGSISINGSVKELFMMQAPKSYTGTDIEEGEDVDIKCSAEALGLKFTRGQFDFVVCTETLEHIENWKSAISNMNRVLAIGGHILLTMPTIGHGYHGYPYDFWRFNSTDLMRIFCYQNGYEIVELRQDNNAKSVMVLARKCHDYIVEMNFDVYSIMARRRCKRVPSFIQLFYRMYWKTRRFLETRTNKRIKKIIKRRLGI